GTACMSDGDVCTLDQCDGAGNCDHDLLPDADGDSVCDAQDPCTNVGGGRDFLARPRSKLVLSKIFSDGTPGNDKLTLSGNFERPPGNSFGSLDPSLRGARIVIETQSGTRRLDQVLPGGLYVSGPARGWKRNGKGTLWQYVDKTATPLAGITSVKFIDKSN